MITNLGKEMDKDNGKESGLVEWMSGRDVIQTQYQFSFTIM